MRVNLNENQFIDIAVRKEDDLIVYYADGIKIGVLDPNKMPVGMTNILMVNTQKLDITAEQMGQLQNAINAIPREDIEKEAQINKEIEEYINERYGELEKIEEIKLLDLDEKERIKEKETTKTKNKKEKEDKEDKDKKKDKDEEKDEKEKTITAKDVTVKQTIELDEKVNDMKDMKQWLGSNLPNDVVRIGVVESYQMREFGSKNTTRYSLVAINKDGTMQPLEKYIPQLHQRTTNGSNPTRENYQVRADGTVEKDAVISEYEVGNKILQLDNQEMGRVQVYTAQESRNSTEELGVQVRDSNTTFRTSKEVRSVNAEYEENGVNTVEEDLKEAKAKEQSNPNTQLTDKDIDGEPGPDYNFSENGITLESGEFVTFERLAIRWGERNDDGSPNPEKSKEMYLKMRDRNMEKTPDQIINLVDNEIEEDMRIPNRNEHEI